MFILDLFQGVDEWEKKNKTKRNNEKKQQKQQQQQQQQHDLRPFAWG